MTPAILRSRRGGLRRIGPWGFLAAAVTALIAPVPIGLALLGVARLLSPEPALMVGLAGMAMLVAPLWSWVGLAIGLPVAAGLLAVGWFGWIPALFTGTLSALAAAEAIGGMGAAPALAAGLPATVAFRTVLAAIRPDAFG